MIDTESKDLDRWLSQSSTLQSPRSGALPTPKHTDDQMIAFGNVEEPTASDDNLPTLGESAELAEEALILPPLRES